ncbi:MAG: aminotransferase class I/II-fold pyridoxal phosphate-dependent enzyme, partial [Clostridiales Family XIII bacterium]|nr:aminotransferase class I/II-fold pyridoxal phosphate-dependent enzyme [Clostridiales Family XIII bacterium]
ADNGRRLVENPLKYEGERYSIDFEDFEQKIERGNVKLFLLCSPHNPVGRVWTCAELEEISRICKRHGVIVVSDEIHCDFVWAAHGHTCYGLVDVDAVIATSPSKTFNLAGLQVSNLFVRNETLRRALRTEITKSGYSQLGTVGLTACRSAYEKGAPWLEALREYLVGNIGYVRDFLAEHLPAVKLVEPEGTYLLWLDFGAYGLPQKELDRRVTEGARLWLDSGTIFGSEGQGFQRINIACPRATVAQAMQQLHLEFGQE